MAAEAQGKLLQAKAESDAARYRREQESLAMLAQKKNEAEALLAMKTAEAQGKKLEAEAIRELNAAMGSNYARIKFFESFKDIKLPSMLIMGGANQNDGLFKVLNIADFKPANN
jgi:regulator of protease activity HflC (stomatin/prohibitin superfamily)